MNHVAAILSDETAWVSRALAEPAAFAVLYDRIGYKLSLQLGSVSEAVRALKSEGRLWVEAFKVSQLLRAFWPQS
jgi:hypothetical protein